MPRPRIYVDRHGRPVQQITGVHYNKGRNRFYITLDDGARQEFRSWEDARAAVVTAQANAMPAEELARIAAIARYRSDLAQRRLYDDERDAFLGHVVRGTSRLYEGDVDETYLVPLVNLIGQHYLDGEQVQDGPLLSVAAVRPSLSAHGHASRGACYPAIETLTRG
jgi:hypothetical protein